MRRADQVLPTRAGPAGADLTGESPKGAPPVEPGGQASPLPKAELHVHIEGTLEAEMVFDLAARNRTPLPFRDVDDLRARYSFTDLGSFLELYYSCMAVLRSEEDFADLADAYLERAASEGVRHAEIFFDPQAHMARGVPLGVVVDGLNVALRAGLRRHGVSCGLIACFLRDQGPEAAMDTLGQLLAHRDAIIGVGLDSAEVGYPPALFADVFARARSEELHCVAHAGEEGPPAYVWEALDVLRVERIDHGVRSLEDPDLVARLADEQVPLTVCPLSNLRLKVVERIEEHPVAAMLEADLAVTVNSDDPAYFGGYVEKNFSLVSHGLGLDGNTLRKLARNSFEAAFIDKTQRNAYIDELGRPA